MMAVNASLLLLRRSRGSFLPLRRSLSAVGVAGASFSSPSSSLVLARKQLTSASSILPWNLNHLSLHQSFRRFSSAAFSSSSAAVAEVAEQPATAAAEVSEQPASSTMKERFKFAYQDHKPRELGIDEIEGCDFNHWLIVVDFPKNPRPSHEEMVRFYEETCSKSLNISLEEAKKKIYACSTSNYTGFHVEVTEVESEKFNGQPGVIFVLPDSYVDKEKKEYGGDKYINGVIIPRPRSGKRIREDFKQDRQRQPIPLRQVSPVSNQERPIQGQRPNQLVQSSYNHEAPTQGRPIPYQQRNTPQDNHHGAPQSNQIPYKNGFQGQSEIKNQGSYQFQQNYSPPLQGENMHQPNRPFQHSYNLPVQGERRDSTPMRSSYRQENGGLAPYQENYNQAGAGNFHPQGLREFPQGYNRVNYAPPMSQGGFREDYQNYGSGDRVPEAYYQNVNTGSIQQGNQGFIQRQPPPGPGGFQGQGAPEPYWPGSDSRSFQRGHLEPIQSQPFSQDQRNFQGPGFEPIRRPYSQDQISFQGPSSEPIRSQPFSQDQRNFQGPSFEPIQGQPYSQDQRNFQGPGYREPIHSQPFSQNQHNLHGSAYHEPIQSQPLSQDQRNLQGPGYRDATQSQPFSQDQRSFQRHGFDPIQSRPFPQDQTNFHRPGVEPIQSRPFSQDQTNFQRTGVEPMQSRPFSQDQTNCQRSGVEPIQSQPLSRDQRNFQGPGFEPIQSQPFSQVQRNFQGPGFEPIHSQPLSHDHRNFQGPEFVPFKSQPFSQDQRNFQGPGFNPQEYREPPPAYQWNYAPPPGYQAGFSGEYGYYSSKPVDLYRQGPTVGGYQAYRNPEAYRQGPNYGGVGPNYNGSSNAQGLSQPEPKYEAGFRHDYQTYGPLHGSMYQHEDNGYQGEGPPAPYWRRSSF